MRCGNRLNAFYDLGRMRCGNRLENAGFIFGSARFLYLWGWVYLWVSKVSASLGREVGQAIFGSEISLGQLDFIMIGVAGISLGVGKFATHIIWGG